MIKLENDHIAVKINPLGAELVSLWKKENETEFMWGADPAYWAKTSPVLFPVVGGLRDGRYLYKDREYKLGRHGFAREKVFETEEKSDSSVTFLLRHDQESLKVYPFEFEFRIVYTLSECSLTVSYEVYNPDKEEELWFSVGGHPAFRIPLNEMSVYGDYYLEFGAEESFQKWPLDENGLVLDKPVGFASESSFLPLSKSLFYEDALVFKDLRSESITIKSDLTTNQLRFTFKGFPFFGIWAAKDADFICLEPWCGIADRQDHSGGLTEKEGINSLKPGEKFVRQWTVEV